MVHYISLNASNTTNIKTALKTQLSDFPIYSGLLLSSLQVRAIYVCQCLRSCLQWSSYTWHIVGVANGLWEQAVPDLPGEDGGALPLVLGHFAHHARSCHPRFRATDSAWLYRARLIISIVQILVNLYLYQVPLLIILANAFTNISIAKKQFLQICDPLRSQLETLHITCPGSSRRSHLKLAVS